MSIDNQKARREEARIKWRAWVMSMPGGVLWLRTQAKILKWKEQLVGPFTITFAEGL